MMNRNSFRKYPSMELPPSPPPPPRPAIPKKSFSFEFPSSPQPTTYPAEEIIHFSLHQHPLARLSLPSLFMCSGCKEYGADKRFVCHQCDFQLHEFCALSPPSINSHSLHAQHQLFFHPKPKQVKGSFLGPKCDVCGKPSKGFALCCSACSFQMHPCCSMFSSQMNFSVHPHPLKLMSSPGDPASFSCGECRRKRSGWVFRCTVCDYHLHAVCAKNLINGLQAGGFKAPPSSPSMLAIAGHFASVVVTQFIGGLIDGLGQGLGQALVQDITTGRNVSGRRGGRRSNNTE